MHFVFLFCLKKKRLGLICRFLLAFRMLQNDEVLGCRSFVMLMVQCQIKMGSGSKF